MGDRNTLFIDPSDGINSSDEFMTFALLVMDRAFAEDGVGFPRVHSITGLDEKSEQSFLQILIRSGVLQQDERNGKRPKLIPAISQSEWYDRYYSFFEEDPFPNTTADKHR